MRDSCGVLPLPFSLLFTFSLRVPWKIVHRAIHSSIHRVVHFSLGSNCADPGAVVDKKRFVVHLVVHFLPGFLEGICEVGFSSLLLPVGGGVRGRSKEASVHGCNS